MMFLFSLIAAYCLIHFLRSSYRRVKALHEENREFEGDMTITSIWAEGVIASLTEAVFIFIISTIIVYFTLQAYDFTFLGGGVNGNIK